ncbi:defensin-like protein [Solanum dulcamara]|uniref:defensin-like protein n=1 Tax=Solanum dulcamara TaxID=45834 RepID=UPI0024869906|nr:defensin-like protein [Solanum dulcamara]
MTGSSKRLFTTMLLLLMVLFATEMEPAKAWTMIKEMERVQARTCQSESPQFMGVCTTNSYCASICNTEGFLDGKCQFFRCRCSRQYC